jgi:hypothetical protein
MTLVIGYWAIPTVITVALFLWTFLTPAEPSTGGYLYFPDPIPLVRFALALIGSLISWLIYFAFLALVSL